MIGKATSVLPALFKLQCSLLQASLKSASPGCPCESSSPNCLFDCQQGIFTLLPVPASSSSSQGKTIGLLMIILGAGTLTWNDITTMLTFPGLQDEHPRITLNGKKKKKGSFLQRYLPDQGIKSPVSEAAWALRNPCMSRERSEASGRAVPLSTPQAGWSMQIFQHTVMWIC